MKTKFFLSIAAIIVIASSSFATIRTVSNSPSTTVAQFNTIQAAIDASVSGDTILVHGSPIDYVSSSITNKQLVIIGPGWSPDKTLPYTARVPGIHFYENCSNTEIQGMVITSSMTVNSSLTNHMRIIRNNFLGPFHLGHLSFSGYLFEGNIFTNNGGINGHNLMVCQDFVIRNNYFFSQSASQIRDFNKSLNTVLIDHNIFFGPTTGNTADVFTTCQHLLITNNIFVNRNAATGNSTSTFDNNLTYNAGNNTPWLSNGNIDADGNISNQNPQMAAQASVDAGINNPLLDFTIAAGPANNAGIDGKDLGLMYDSTGSLNWANGRNSRFPRIYSMVITNSIIPSGGTLNVTVEGRQSN